MRSRDVLTFVVLAAGFLILPAQGTAMDRWDPEAEIASVVHRLFEAMRAGDGPAAASLFHPHASLFSFGEVNGEPVLRSSNAAEFARAIGTPRTEVWDERIANLEIRTDGPLGTAWMDYAFYIDDTLSHCGVNAIQLFRSPGGWQILQIADTRRPDGCRVN
jgi:hypothetical protein